MNKLMMVRITRSPEKFIKIWHFKILDAYDNINPHFLSIN